MLRILVALACSSLGTPAASIDLPAPGDQPRVVRALPDNADLLSPALTEMRFEFDRPMSRRGHSLCGGGDTFPSIAGPVRWESDTVLVVPVRLAPDHEYQFSLNCPGAQGLRSADGQTLDPYPIRFRTLPEGSPPPMLDNGAALRALDALRAAIDDRYSYRDLRVADWDGVFAAAEQDVLASESPAQLARAIARLLAPAQDIHTSVVVNDMTIGTHRRLVTPNFDVRLIAGLVPNLDQATRRVAVGRWDDGVAYILIGGWDGVNQAQDLPAILDAIDSCSGAPGLVIDVRINSGGNEDFARAVAARVASRQAAYARSLIRDPSEPDGFAGPFERTVAPDPRRPDQFEPPARLAVLIGPACMSSNESFIRMMDTACDARLFGDQTYGSSGNPRPHDVGSGVTVVLPSWQDIDTDGQILEGRGIAPDERIPWPADSRTDPVLNAALEWIRGSESRHER